MAGRPKNSVNVSKYIWSVKEIDPLTNDIIKDLGKYTCLNDFNKQNNLKMTPHKIYRLRHLDKNNLETKLLVKSSFEYKYAHLQFDKIDEPIEYVKVRIN